LKGVRSDILFRVLFSLVFWFFWIVLPLLNAVLDSDNVRLDKLINVLPLNLMAIPFFYIIGELLSTRLLLKGKLTVYFLSVSLTFGIYLFCYVLLKDYLIDYFPIRVYDSRTLFPVLFVMGMSTLYGLILLIISQNRSAEEEKAERMRSELSFLRSQISPHFIFNILNSIVYLIRVKSDNAEKVTIELSKLIRYILYESENKYVLLEKEIEYLENYVGLQKVRFEEDVDIQLNIVGNPTGLFIEPMLLIPFVENAFKHGVGFIKDPFIKIELSITPENSIQFKVTNKCSPKLDEAPKDASSGIGIKNVRRRIELLYPATHKLQLKEENGVFDVYLRLILKNSER
jgi:two-component system LytT family sensor kinase